MSQFNFRFERVLAYRRLEEHWARESLILARRACEEQLAAIEVLRNRQAELLAEQPNTVAHHQGILQSVAELDRQVEFARRALEVLENERDAALAVWIDRRRNAELMEKLRERNEAEWLLDMTRKEQRELDEWALMARAA